MAGMFVNVVVNGLVGVKAKLSGTISRSLDLSIPLKEASLYMMGSINENFEASGRPIPWTPLAESTRRSRSIRIFRSRTKSFFAFSRSLEMRPLLGKGILRGSMTPQVGLSYFSIGTNLIYARIHQFGGMAGRNHAAKIPARPYLLFQVEDIPIINQMVTDYIVGA